MLSVFRYNYKEEYTETAKKIREKLTPYKKYERLVNEWPSTKTDNAQKHLYLYTLYEVSNEVKDILLTVDNLYEWNYDKYPMDLCFFKDGYSFFYSSAHEHFAVLCTSDKAMLSELTKMGLKIEYLDEKLERDVFYDQVAEIGLKKEYTGEELSQYMFYDEVALKDYDTSNLSEKYKTNIDDVCKYFSTTIAKTEKYRFVTDNDKLIAEVNETGEEILIAEQIGIENYKRKAFFKNGNLFVALTVKEYSSFFSNAKSINTSGIWTVDGNTLEKSKIIEGEFTNIVPILGTTKILAYNGKDFFNIDTLTGSIEKEAL